MGVDENVIRRFHIILEVLSSEFAVNLTAFKLYCFKSTDIFVSLYPWYCMPTTVHKVLIHDYLIIEWSPLSTGQILEDAQEARNKDMKKYRQYFARKHSRLTNMQDVFKRLLFISDP